MKFVSDQYLHLQTVILAVLFLSGCATVQQPKRPLELSTMNLDSASQIASAAPGSLLSVSIDKGAAPIQGTVGETYYAASNRECKRFVPLDMRGQTERVVCRHSSNIWYMQRALPVRSTAIQAQPISNQPITPSIIQVPEAEAIIDESLTIQQPVLQPSETISAVIVEPVDVKVTTEVFRVEPDETLLKFSERVTGSRSNWLNIARQNGLEDPYTLSVGMPLQVPSDLVKIN